jgi:hypothetical protein
MHVLGWAQHRLTAQLCAFTRAAPVPPQEKLRAAESAKISLEGETVALKEAIAERKMEAEREVGQGR